MYDQPEIDYDMASTADGQLLSLAPKGKPKLSKKARRHVDHHRGMDYVVTPAQTLMRREMTAAKAVEEVAGSSTASAEVQALALAVIQQTPNDLILGFKEWRSVQDMVEAAIRVGYERGAEDWAPDRG